jgi:hypothetical protein
MPIQRFNLRNHRPFRAFNRPQLNRSLKRSLRLTQHQRLRSRRQRVETFQTSAPLIRVSQTRFSAM